MERISKICLSLMVMAGAAASASGQVTNFRITEVDPIANTVEIWNDGPAFTTTAAHPFCHRFNYATSIPSGTAFTAGQRRTFTVTNLNDTDSDLWLYISSPFGTAANIIHGLKYGPQANIGRTALASGRVPPLWTGSARFAPAPVSGQSLAWDGFGIDPRDFYIDATPTFGAADSTSPGTVPGTILSTGGIQDFENVSLGDTIEAIADWFIIDSSAIEGQFTARAVHDVNGSITPRGTSSRWIRIRDQDASDVQNRFYGGEIVASAFESYTWSFFINIEETPPAPGASNFPRLLIQHNDGGGNFVNTWGVELLSTGGFLVGPGLVPQPLFPLSGATGLLNWIRIDFTVNFTASTISASVNSIEVVTDAPISLPDVSQTNFRFCYRGEGKGNTASILLDDLGLAFESAPMPCPGDADGNNMVDFGDIAAILAAFGTVYTPGTGFGDADGSGVVDFGDAASVLANFGTNCN